MIKNKHNLLSLFLLLMAVVLPGCASTTINTKDEKTENTGSVSLETNSGKLGSNMRIADFILGVGDTIDISVYRHDDLKKTIKIDSSGSIMFPLIGDVQAAGIGIVKLRDDIREKLSKYVIDPQVAIGVSGIQSQKVMVLGEVKTPGVFALDSNISIMEAISKAGGMTSDAKMKNVLLIRRKQDKLSVTALNLTKVYKEGDISQNWMMQSGDIVFLPPLIIANIARYADYVRSIVSPIVQIESGISLWPEVESVLGIGGSGGGTQVTPSIGVQ